MSKGSMPGGPRVVGNRVTLRRLTADRDARTMVDTGDVQPGAHVSFTTADRDRGAERLDAAAGCEFVDDRIRLLE